MSGDPPREPYPLEILLQAPSKVAVNDLFLLAFQTRFDGASPKQLAEIDEWLGVGAEQCEQILAIVRKLIYSATYSSLDASGIRRLLPSDFHDALAKLIIQITLHHLEGWRADLVDAQAYNPAHTQPQAHPCSPFKHTCHDLSPRSDLTPLTPSITGPANQVSIPRLAGVDWRIDVKTASDSLTRMAVPTCLVELQVQGCPERRGELPAVRHLAFEMNREALGAMLDGLGKIRDQLSQVAQ
jgi:hypothetical protein